MDKEKEEQELKQKVLEAITVHPSYGYLRLIPELKKKRSGCESQTTVDAPKKLEHFLEKKNCEENQIRD